MDIARIKKHLYAEIRNLREIDINASLDMFLLQNKVAGVSKYVDLDLDTFLNQGK